MNATFLLAGLLVGAGASARAATPLTESVFTEVIRDVNVVAAADKSVVPAVTNAVFHVPDRVRTGLDSRVEMTAPDRTITRVGANTVFTFEPAGRNILLEKGSVLFHSPAGAGGGAVLHRGTAAAVLGTTMVCAVLPDGSFKILDLEGHVQVTLKNHTSVFLKAGQMVIVPPEGTNFDSVLTFNLGQLTARLLLLVGFSNPLASLPAIATAIQLQNDEIADDTLSGLASLLTAGLGLDLIPGPSLPPWMMNAPDSTQVFISPVRTSPFPTWILPARLFDAGNHVGN